MLSLLFLTLSLGVSLLSAQEPQITCPEGSSSGKDVTTFLVSTPPSTLYPHMGDFYSPSWESLLLRDDNFTFFPVNRTRTLTYYDLTTTETLLYNSSITTGEYFSLTWELSSGTFAPNSRFRVTYYQQSIEALPMCSGGTMSLVTWNTTACIDGDAKEGAEWFGGLHRIAAQHVFDEIAEGWMDENAKRVMDSSDCRRAGVGGTNGTSNFDPDSGDGYMDVPQLHNGGLRRGATVWLVVGAVLVGLFSRWVL